LAPVLHGWDGKFNILMRKRIARHIESCAACESERRRSVSPQALLGAAPLLIPAPAWLKNSVTRDFELTSASHGMASSHGMATALNPKVEHSQFHSAPTAAGHVIQPPPDTPPQEPVPLAANPTDGETKRRVVPLMALLIGVPLAVLGVAVAWVYLPSMALAPSGVVQPAPSPTPAPSISAPTAAVNPAPPPPGAARPGIPTPTQVAPRPSPAAALPTPQAKLPTPQPQAPQPPIEAPPVQAPMPPLLPQPPIGSIPRFIPAIPAPQNPAQVPAQRPAQAPAQLPAQVPAEAPAQVPAQAPAQAPAQVPAQVPDPVGPAPKQIPDPVGPAPAKTACDPTVELCVK